MLEIVAKLNLTRAGKQQGVACGLIGPALPGGPELDLEETIIGMHFSLPESKLF